MPDYVAAFTLTIMSFFRPTAVGGPSPSSAPQRRRRIDPDAVALRRQRRTRRAPPSSLR